MSNTADTSDRATQLEELERESALNLQRLAAARNRLKPIGLCYDCQDQIQPGATFCDRDCRDNWERRRAARERNGTA